MIAAPWWVRWLVSAAVMALTLTATVALVFPNFVATTGWLWRLVGVVVLSLAFASAADFIQNPVRRSYAAAVTGLNPQQRSQIRKALRHGEVPADPRALAAAIRVGTLSLAYLRRAARWQKTPQWWMPAFYIVLAVVDFIIGIPRQGLLWLGFALYFAAYFGWTSHRRRQLPQHVARLRAVAAETFEAASAAADTEDSVTLPPRRMWASVVLAVVAAIAIGAGVIAWGLPRQSPDCRTADQTLSFIYAHQDMLDGQLITAGGPDLHRYQVWSDQLQDYARHVSAPEISRHLHRIAELSVQAVSQVQDIRKDPLVSPPPNVIRDHQTAYQNTMSQLVAEDGDLVPICHPRI